MTRTHVIRVEWHSQPSRLVNATVGEEDELGEHLDMEKGNKKRCIRHGRSTRDEYLEY